MANPAGAKAREPYKNFDGEGLPRNQLRPFHIGRSALPLATNGTQEGLGIGGCFFASFFAPKKE